MKKAAPILLLVVLGLLAIALRHGLPGTAQDRQPRPQAPVVADPPGGGLNRSVPRLVYTRHAQCRMDCRHITEDEILDILQHGSINYRKTELDGKPCPAYALEGYTQKEHEHLRIVFAQCERETKVVTCIDLDHDFECHCPGDENKHEQ